MITIYGIKNCSSMKKAFDALEAKSITYTFHDYKKLGIDRATLQHWAEQVGLDVLLNKKGTTWRKFTTEQQAAILSSPEATVQALVDYTSLIKRPVLVNGKQILVGFDAENYAKLTV